MLRDCMIANAGQLAEKREQLCLVESQMQSNRKFWELLFAKTSNGMKMQYETIKSPKDFLVPEKELSLQDNI